MASAAERGGEPLPERGPPVHHDYLAGVRVAGEDAVELPATGVVNGEAVGMERED
jgi:hypothetical protein